MENRARWPIKKWMRAYLFILPALVFYVVFSVIPTLGTLRYSFFQWDGVSPVLKFVGIRNYIQLIHDPIFWESIFHNAIWIIATIIIPVFLGLVLAVLLSARNLKGRLFFRVCFFLPSVISYVAVGIVWGWIYEPSTGLLDNILSHTGLSVLSRAWLGDPGTVLGAIIAASSWAYFGFCMVIFFSAVQGLDPSLYEAAMLEGCSPIRTFFSITIPLLKNVITLLVLNSLIASFKVFDLVYVMTDGGPFHSSEVLGTYMYQQSFFLNNVGYGSAISVVLAIIAGACTVIYLRIAERD